MPSTPPVVFPDLIPDEPPPSSGVEPSAPPLPSSSSSPSHQPWHQQNEDPEDVAARAMAAQSRAEGIADMQHHLHGHLQNNPQSSFVSWIATLHPENATVQIDDRFKIADNPWLVAYGEAVNGMSPPSLVATPIHHHHHHPSTGANGIEEGGENSAYINEDFPHSENTNDNNDNNNENNTRRKKKKRRKCAGILDFAVGIALIITAVFITLFLELSALILYLHAFLFTKFSRLSSNPQVTLLSLLPYIIFTILKSIFRLLDIFLLYISIILSEFLSLIAFLICGFLALDCIDVALFWHQNLRKSCHLTRWAFRQMFITWDPPRNFQSNNNNDNNNDNDDDNEYNNNNHGNNNNNNDENHEGSMFVKKGDLLSSAQCPTVTAPPPNIISATVVTAVPFGESSS